MPELLTYYKSLKRREKGVLSRKIFLEGGIPYVTLHRKMNLKNFSLAEEIAISKILEMDQSELFPTNN